MRGGAIDGDFERADDYGFKHERRGEVDEFRYVGTATGSGLEYMTGDHLGSTRMVTSAVTPTQPRRLDSLPYGEALLDGTGGRTTGAGYEAAEGLSSLSVRFTGKERDSETASSMMPGLDYFGARYYGAGMGRFTGPDWSEKPQATPYADLSNPQTLNLYSYGRNNPLTNKDEDGHCTVDGEEHGRVWCFLHSFGVVNTERETKRIQIGMANIGADEYSRTHPEFDRSKYTQEQILEMYRNGVFSKTREDPADPLQLLGIVTVGSFPPEDHHLLPRQFRNNFERAGLDIEKYTIEMERAAHRLKPDGLHARGPSGWNQKWAEFFRNNPSATRDQILNHLERLKVEFKLK